MPCAIARSMAVLGERWTLVILRSAFMGARRFEDYQSSTGIARNILTDRLKTLVEHDILERRPYAEHPGRTLYEYRLTDKGLDLYPVLVSLMQWGNRYGGFGAPPAARPSSTRRSRTTTSSCRAASAARRRCRPTTSTATACPRSCCACTPAAPTAACRRGSTARASRPCTTSA